jgi:hypothetical protein
MLKFLPDRNSFQTANIILHLKMNVHSLFRQFLLTLIFIVSATLMASATHLRAGEIIVERVDCSSLTFRVTVTVYTNTIGTNVEFGGEDDWLDFGNGRRILVPQTPNTIRADLGPGIATASFTDFVTYSGPGQTETLVWLTWIIR